MTRPFPSSKLSLMKEPSAYWINLRTSQQHAPDPMISAREAEKRGDGISMQLQELLGGELASANAKRQDMEEEARRHVARRSHCSGSPRGARACEHVSRSLLIHGHWSLLIYAHPSSMPLAP